METNKDPFSPHYGQTDGEPVGSPSDAVDIDNGMPSVFEKVGPDEASLEPGELTVYFNTRLRALPETIAPSVKLEASDLAIDGLEANVNNDLKVILCGYWYLSFIPMPDGKVALLSIPAESLEVKKKLTIEIPAEGGSTSPTEGISTGPSNILGMDGKPL
jgi:hypothetical protein